MSSRTRRELLQRIAAAALAGPLASDAAQHVHQEAAKETAAAGGVYRPQALTAHEYATLQALCELIVPGASKGHAAEFIDLLSRQNSEMAAVYTGGLAWLDHAMERSARTNFLAAKPADQTALLDRIAYRRNTTPELAAGIGFFDWVRRMTVDAYYTSSAGIQELGYLGNKGAAEFKVPQAAIDYALKRSPFA
ncbi:MAG TPA: gluconate 2-dehydrogenase subunit 3 family protein [Bryobacteraceae bacterium]|nr:gluconate 2-dehydrogenase subunit 3 family protein [Bryobacteraceae bacterium]